MSWIIVFINKNYVLLNIFTSKHNYKFIFLQRVKLFNAYSNDVMCKAGVSFLDIYPMSASYPYGTKDGIHYDSKVFYPVEDLLVNYFDREYR